MEVGGDDGGAERTTLTLDERSLLRTVPPTPEETASLRDYSRSARRPLPGFPRIPPPPAFLSAYPHSLFDSDS